MPCLCSLSWPLKMGKVVAKTVCHEIMAPALSGTTVCFSHVPFSKITKVQKCSTNPTKGSHGSSSRGRRHAAKPATDSSFDTSSNFAKRRLSASSPGQQRGRACRARRHRAAAACPARLAPGRPRRPAAPAASQIYCFPGRAHKQACKRTSVSPAPYHCWTQKDARRFCKARSSPGRNLTARSGSTLHAHSVATSPPADAPRSCTLLRSKCCCRYFTTPSCLPICRENVKKRAEEMSATAAGCGI